MYENLIEKILSSLPKDNKIAVAVSGGADSVALLHILNYIKSNIVKDLELIVFHIDHGLRLESAQDAEWVRNLATSLNIKSFNYKLPPKPTNTGEYGGVEGWAREYRLYALAKLAIENNIKYIALAHHKDDLAETILLRIIRGTTVKGLIGIKEFQTLEYDFGKVVLWRPLLNISKEELINWLKSKNFDWIEDKSNQSLQYERNKIRHQVLPLLERIRKNAKYHIINLATDAANIYRFISKFLKKIVKIDKNKLLIRKKINRVNLILFLEGIRKWLIHLNKLYKLKITISRKIINSLLDLLVRNKCGRKFAIKHFYFVRTNAGLECVFKDLRIPKRKNSHFEEKLNSSSAEDNLDLILLKNNEISRFSDGYYYLLCSDSEQIEKIENKFNLSNEYEIVDKIWIPKQLLDNFGSEITVRYKKSGDKFFPKGGVGHKKLAKWFIDNKIAAHIRNKISLVCIGTEVLWIPDYKCSNFVSKLEKENHLLLLRMKKAL